MSVGLFAQVLVNGLMSGGTYALIASGFTLILGVIQVFNFSQAHFYMLGAFVTFGVAVSLGLPYPVAILAALAAMAILGMLLHLSIVKWVMPFGFTHTMLATIAFGRLISQVSVLTFGSQAVVVPSIIPGTLAIGEVTLNEGKLLVIGSAIVVMAVLYYFMKSKAGTAILASAENKDVAGLQGINANKIFLIVMAIGCGLSGIGGALVVPILSASSTMWIDVFTRSMLVILVGGTGSMSGALIAAFLIGIIESFAYQFVGQLSLMVIYVFAGILIVFRPGGLMGRPLPIPGG
jgi:branched-chain amino acid transport system permease protein